LSIAFGAGTSDTPDRYSSDFGTQGEKPTHPELLDDLAARFVANGWSLKWLHREIMLSATYRQSSKPRADGKRDRCDQSLALAHEFLAAWMSRHIATRCWKLRERSTPRLGGPSADLDAAGEQPSYRVREGEPWAI